MIDTSEELRIIAKDGGKLSASDCALIALAADELEHTQLLLIHTQAAMIEALARQIAVNEQLIEARRRPSITFSCPPLWRLSLGFPRCP